MNKLLVSIVLITLVILFNGYGVLMSIFVLTIAAYISGNIHAHEELADETNIAALGFVLIVFCICVFLIARFFAPLDLLEQLCRVTHGWAFLPHSLGDLLLSNQSLKTCDAAIGQVSAISCKWLEKSHHFYAIYISILATGGLFVTMLTINLTPCVRYREKPIALKYILQVFVFLLIALWSFYFLWLRKLSLEKLVDTGPDYDRLSSIAHIAAIWFFIWLGARIIISYTYLLGERFGR